MPPLQVRDCPAELYERLRACAKEENRSISQQVLTILEDFLDARDIMQGDPEYRPDVYGLYQNGRLRRMRPSYSHKPHDGIDRAEKRRKIFEELESLPAFPLAPDAPRADEILRQIREEEAR